MPKFRAKIGVIGGSGLYALDDLEVLTTARPKTPFGRPSDEIVIGRVAGHEVAFLPRHGRGHRLLPTEVPSKANIAALKSLGVEKIIAFSAVGSLKEKLAPLDFCIPSQVIDRTRLRDHTFFGAGVVGHVAFAEPFSRPLSDILYRRARTLGLKVHRDETLICMEGPAFSTRAESHLYRSWGAGLINMSALPEAKLAREAEISYGLVCMVTDYDCWREEAADVDIQMVIDNLNRNAENAKRLLREALDEVAALEDDSGPRTASRFAIITDRSLIPKQTWKNLRYLFPQYFGGHRKDRRKDKDQAHAPANEVAPEVAPVSGDAPATPKVAKARTSRKQPVATRQPQATRKPRAKQPAASRRRVAGARRAPKKAEPRAHKR